MSEKNLHLYSAINTIVTALLAVWPDHQKHINSRFKDDSEAFLHRTNELAELALKLIGGDLQRYCEDYQWMCQNFLEEQWYFQRHGDYRLKSFAAADKEIYSNQAYMSRYVRGILISQIVWKNHANAIDIFRTTFLPKNKDNTDYLEVGPGHGLFFYFAALNNRNRSLTGWDVSDSSISATQHAMKQFNVPDNRFTLVHQDILGANCPANGFDAVIISEVLEHLESPEVALKSLYKAMRSGGRIFINVPLNSPAPDHIYLWGDTEEVAALVRGCGFHIDEEHYLPISHYSLEYSRKHKIDISCVIIASKL